MIVWRFRESPALNRYPGAPEVQGHRWVLDVGWDHVSLERQVRHDDEWHDVHASYFSVYVTKHFKLGSQHIYYDGPHCSFSLGFVHFNWRYWDCRRCLSDGFGDDGENS